MSELYENLLKATDNTSDITMEKYGVITKISGNLCSIKEYDTELEHSNVPIINGANLGLGDKVIIGFLNNSIYDVVCYGVLDKTVHDTTKQDKLISGENIKTINNNSILGSGNLVIEGGGTGVDIVTEWETTTSDSKVASEKLTKDTLDTKVDKENGKGLSSNDFTNNYKSTMDNLKTVATTGSYTDLTNKPSIPSASSSTPSADTSSGAAGTGTTWARADHKHPKSNIYAESSHTHTKSQITDFPTLSTVATTGDYDDLLDKPNIPSKTSDLTNDGDGTNAFLTQHQSLANYVQKSSTNGLLKNDGSVDTTQYLSSLPNHNHDDRYYTEAEVDTALNSKQNTLISGTNIKTINNTSLLGTGNINIQGGGSITIDSTWITGSTNPVESQLIQSALDDKTDVGHTHNDTEINSSYTNIETSTVILATLNDVLTYNEPLTRINRALEHMLDNWDYYD